MRSVLLQVVLGGVLLSLGPGLGCSSDGGDAPAPVSIGGQGGAAGSSAGEGSDAAGGNPWGGSHGGLCVPGEQRSCDCEVGSIGAQRCLSDGSGWGLCLECVASSGGSSSGGASTATGGTGMAGSGQAGAGQGGSGAGQAGSGQGGQGGAMQGPSCGEVAAQNGWAQANCESNGNGACDGSGTPTWDCDFCCQVGGGSGGSGGSSTGGGCCIVLPSRAASQGFSGCGQGSGHFGVDYGGAQGAPVLAGISGTVVGVRTGLPNCGPPCPTNSACWLSGFNYIKIKADCGDPANPNNDLFLYYLHVIDVMPGVSQGASVSQGQHIASVGNSGCSTGPHDHVEVVSVPKGQNASLATCNSVDPATRACN